MAKTTACTNATTCLDPLGGNAQQHIGAEHVEQKYDVKEAGKVEHGYGCGYILYEYKKI